MFIGGKFRLPSNQRSKSTEKSCRINLENKDSYIDITLRAVNYSSSWHRYLSGLIAYHHCVQGLSAFNYSITQIRAIHSDHTGAAAINHLHTGPKHVKRFAHLGETAVNFINLVVLARSALGRKDAPSINWQPVPACRKHVGESA